VIASAINNPIHRLAFIGNYLPRPWSIAPLTTDLRAADFLNIHNVEKRIQHLRRTRG
jgi:hypothetical protein